METEKKHQKHEHLARPAYGTFHRNEWALLGAPCGVIRSLVVELSRQLGQRWNCAYADADHGSGESEKAARLPEGLTLAYTDKIGFHRFDRRSDFNTYHWRMQCNDVDVVFVNGNHFTAKRQVVIVHPAKLESLQRKLDRLTNVDAVLLAEGVSEVPPFLKPCLAADVPVWALDAQPKLVSFFEEKLKAAVPPVKGLVLAGGRSRRMKQDKSLLEYHGMPQRDYVYRQLQQVCGEVYMSCRPEQGAMLMLEYPLVVDAFLNLGPLGAILSAFRQEPDTAWLVVACDLPLLDVETLEFLLQQRNPSAVATAFRSPHDGWPEPLVALWEPRAYPLLLEFMAQGYSCPRKVLINSRVHLVDAADPAVLRNANTPEEAVEIAAEIARRKR